MFPAVMELREVIYKEFPYKDQRGTWGVDLEFRRSGKLFKTLLLRVIT